MSRLCRLKTKSHGEDGLWAYQEITQLRAKVAELQSSHDALKAQLAKYQNLEPVGYFEQEYVGGPVLFYQVNYKAEGSIPLYALEMK